MSGEAPLVHRSFAVGRRTCEVTIPRPPVGGVISMVVEWLPEPPRQLAPEELAEYRRGRDAAVAEAARLIGMTAAVIEV